MPMENPADNIVVKKLLEDGFTQVNTPNEMVIIPPGNRSKRLFIGIKILEVTKRDGTKITCPLEIVLTY